MASNSQFTEMFLEWPLSKIVSEILTCPWTWLWLMEATWLYEHKQIPEKSSLKLLVRFWNNLIEMFLEWPFLELFFIFWSVNKHGISEWRLLALYRQREILVNSSLKTTRKKRLEQSQKIRWAIQGHLGPLVLTYHGQISSLRSPSICQLQLLSIWTILKFCRLAKS